MPQGVAAERVAGEQRGIRREHQGADADAEMFYAVVVEPERLPNVVRQQHDEDQGEVQEIAMDILDDQGKSALAEIALARFADRAGGRVRPERFVVRAAVIVAGEA